MLWLSAIPPTRQKTGRPHARNSGYSRGRQGAVIFKDSYDDPQVLDGFSGKTANIDKEFSLTLMPFEVPVYEEGGIRSIFPGIRGLRLCSDRRDMFRTLAGMQK